MDSKRCKDCGETKPLDEFYLSRRRGRSQWSAYCKPCHYKRNVRDQKEYRARGGPVRYNREAEVVARFWSYVDKAEDDRKCWMWIGPATAGRPGGLYYRGGKRNARMISFLLHGGELGDEQVLKMRCRNSLCVNPAHIQARNRDNLTETADKICSRCVRELPLSAFAANKRNKSGVSRYCRDCTRLIAARHSYGISEGDFQRMLDEQGGVCAICQKPSSRGHRLSVDHCHETQAARGEMLIRGLLCERCNLGVGMFEDDCDLLLRVIAYLRKWEAVKHGGAQLGLAVAM